MTCLLVRLMFKWVNNIDLCFKRKHRPKLFWAFYCSSLGLLRKVAGWGLRWEWWGAAKEYSVGVPTKSGRSGKGKKATKSPHSSPFFTNCHENDCH